ncbi:MAG: antirestriction protein [Planctomycetaceae bacterium]|nr:antirestriction protein [Planctomycetaceae bacterium]
MQDLNKKLTEQIIEQMETLGDNWLRPFGAIGGAPINAITGEHYKGGNYMMFSLFADCHVLATYKQWQSVGAQVRKGEKGIAGFKYGTFVKENAQGKEQTHSYASSFTVFSITQCDNVPDWIIDAAGLNEKVDTTEVVKNIDEFIKNTKAKVTTGQPCYIPSQDTIQMPDRSSFVSNTDASSTSHYYSTFLHELTHWTKGPGRLDRKSGKRFGDPAYAFEELIAELGAAMLCARLGLDQEPTPDHAKYLNNWLKALKKDTKLVWDAAKYAQAAVDHLLTYQPENFKLAA